MVPSLQGTLEEPPNALAKSMGPPCLGLEVRGFRFFKFKFRVPPNMKPDIALYRARYRASFQMSC